MVISEKGTISLCKRYPILDYVQPPAGNIPENGFASDFSLILGYQISIKRLTNSPGGGPLIYRIFEINGKKVCFPFQLFFDHVFENIQWLIFRYFLGTTQIPSFFLPEMNFISISNHENCLESRNLQKQYSGYFLRKNDAFPPSVNNRFAPVNWSGRTSTLTVSYNPWIMPVSANRRQNNAGTFHKLLIIAERTVERP